MSIASFTSKNLVLSMSVSPTISGDKANFLAVLMASGVLSGRDEAVVTEGVLEFDIVGPGGEKRVAVEEEEGPGVGVKGLTGVV